MPKVLRFPPPALPNPALPEIIVSPRHIPEKQEEKPVVALVERSEKIILKSKVLTFTKKLDEDNVPYEIHPIPDGYGGEDWLVKYICPQNIHYCP